ncbi:hypothetical protein [Pseudonocardia nigra]|uniref:hypothetical protein n=1 Tax=Pseudonocardia nigra TaxID=1921578 RepID=UPI001FE66C3A|nr:hypothetical protein [Pseudonocardia nigra]
MSGEEFPCPRSSRPRCPPRRPRPSPAPRLLRVTGRTHIDLLLGPGLVRQYSLCGAADHPDAWRIACCASRRAAAGPPVCTNT